MVKKKSRLAKVADFIETSATFRLVRILEVLAIFAALVGFFWELQNRSTDRAVRIATLHAQIAQTLDTDRGRSAARASVIALAGENVSMAGINLMGADLRSLDLSGADFQLSNLAGTSLNDAKAQMGNFSGANLNQADLSGADFSRSDLSGAFLLRAGISAVDFTEANLNGAHLETANLRNSNLTKARLIGANLDGAFLDGAELTGADLTHATLQGASLIGACYNSTPPKLPSGYSVPAC